MINTPTYIKEILELLNNNFEAVIVGGYVRDKLLNRQSNDIDIATSATPDEVIQVFYNYPIYKTGIKHGTVTLNYKGHLVEITTYRIEKCYQDFRHPQQVLFSNSLKEDCRRRDFTINALCLDLNNEIIDYYHGLTDIQNKLIRAIDDPNTRFNEDALRILRAIRFSIQLGFEIEPRTKDALFNNMENLSYIAIERCMSEFYKIISEDYISILIEYFDIFKIFINELSTINDKHICKLRLLNDRCLNDKILRLTCLFSIIQDSNPMLDLRKTLKKIKLSNTEIEQIMFLLNHKNDIYSHDKISLKLLLSKFKEKTNLLLTWKYILTNDESYTKCIPIINQIIAMKECYLCSQLSINGNDLISLNFKGKIISDILNECLKKVIMSELENKKETLIDFIKKNY